MCSLKLLFYDGVVYGAFIVVVKLMRRVNSVIFIHHVSVISFWRFIFQHSIICSPSFVYYCSGSYFAVMFSVILLPTQLNLRIIGYISLLSLCCFGSVWGIIRALLFQFHEDVCFVAFMFYIELVHALVWGTIVCIVTLIYLWLLVSLKTVIWSMLWFSIAVLFSCFFWWRKTGTWV